MAKFDMIKAVKGLAISRRAGLPGLNAPVGPTGPAGDVDFDRLTQEILADPDFNPSNYLYEAFKQLIIDRIYKKAMYHNSFQIDDPDSLDEVIIDRINQK
jgi:hypothetical protein